MRSRLVGLLIVLSLLLAGCVVTVSPVDGGAYYGTDPLILSFEPTRGEGAVYSPGDSLVLVLRANQPGLVTLTAVDPGGRRYVLARDVPVQRGLNYFPSASDRFVYSLTSPYGRHRVQAAFTGRAGHTNPAGSVTYESRRRNWSSTITIDLPFPHPLDVAETYFYVY